MSTNGTFIKSEKIGKGKKVEVDHGVEIWLLPATRVKPDETFGFKLVLNEKVEEEK